MSALPTESDAEAAAPSDFRPSVYMAVLLALGLSHLPNDTIQSLIPAVYPMFKDTFALDFAKFGLITLTFQIAGHYSSLPSPSTPTVIPSVFGGARHDLLARRAGQPSPGNAVKSAQPWMAASENYDPAS